MNFALLFLGALSLHFFYFHDLIYSVSFWFHKTCLDWAPPGPHHDLYQSIVCGNNLKNPLVYHSFQQTGLLHILIVSGSHLIFLKQSIDRFGPWLPMGKSLILLILFFYMLACRMDPPVTRAFVAIVVFLLNDFLKLNWSSIKATHVAGIMTLCLFPEWLLSPSLIMSWVAALSIIVFTNPLKQSFLCYFFLLPIFSSFAPLSPWSIIINASFTPIIGVVLFPLSLFSFFIPYLSKLCDFAWTLTIETVEALANDLPVTNTLPTFEFSTPHLWAYLFVIQWIIFLTHWIRKRRLL